MLLRPARTGSPAEERVTGRLHDPLAADNALTFLLVLALARVGGENRLLGLLELEEERILIAVTHQQHHEGLRADRTNADDLARNVGATVAADYDPAVGLKRLEVVAEGLVDKLVKLLHHPERDRHDDRRVGLDLEAIIGLLGKSIQRTKVSLRFSLGGDLADPLRGLFIAALVDSAEDVCHIDALVPNLKERQLS